MTAARTGVEGGVGGIGVVFILGTLSGVRFCAGSNFIRPAQGTAVMLWSEPWLNLASSAEGTRIPPPRPALANGTSFYLLPIEERLTEDWLTFVGSGLSVAAARERVRGPGTLIAWLEGPEGAATCLLRLAGGRIWRLESFVARPRGRRLGELLLRCVMWHLWFLPGDQQGATLVFQWELAGVPALAGAWWRGWLGAAVAVERGWRWRRTAEKEKCGFCPVTDAWVPPSGEIAGRGRPVVVRDPSADWMVVIADSGLCDGWGYVLAYSGKDEVDWSSVAAVGRWRDLWYRASSAPLGDWTWTGEWVVIGRVGVGQPVQTRWLTAEIV